MSDAPRRAYARNAKDARAIPNTVWVGRGTKWANPFVVGKPGGVYTAKVMNRRHAWQLYFSVALQSEILGDAARAELFGANLACSCPLPCGYDDDECHAATLLKIANHKPPEGT